MTTTKNLDENNVKAGFYFKTYQVKDLPMIFGAFKNVHPDFCFRCEKDGIHWNQIDSTRAFFTSGIFRKNEPGCTYEIKGNCPIIVTIGLNLIEGFFQCIKVESSFSIMYNAITAEIVLITDYENNRIIMRTEALDVNDEVAEVLPTCNYIATFQMDAAELQRHIRTIHKFDQKGDIEIGYEKINNKEAILFFGYKDSTIKDFVIKKTIELKDLLTDKDDFKKKNLMINNINNNNALELVDQLIKIDQDNKKPKNVKDSFSVIGKEKFSCTFYTEFLRNALSITPVDKYVFIKIGENNENKITPIIIEYKLDKLGEIKFVIFPKFDFNTENDENMDVDGGIY